MHVHVRLREGKDDDIRAWYQALDDKSEAVRDALRVYVRMESLDPQQAGIQEVIAQEFARLPDVISAAVHEALSAHQLTISDSGTGPIGEDPALAARLDEQLDDFFRSEEDA